MPGTTKIPQATTGLYSVYKLGACTFNIFLYMNHGEFFLRDSKGIEIRSFQLGAVRNMLSKDKKEEWIRLEKWLETIKPRKKLIGIGGNIRSFLQAHDKKELSVKELNKKIKEFSRLSTQEKIFKYKFI